MVVNSLSFLLVIYPEHVAQRASNSKTPIGTNSLLSLAKEVGKGKLAKLLDNNCHTSLDSNGDCYNSV